MKDILLTGNGDIYVSETGDIIITDSVKQAVRIRLAWILNEWKYAPGFGLPYFENIFIKNPNIEHIQSIVRDEALSVDGVRDAVNINFSIDKAKRLMHISADIFTDEETYREEVTIDVRIWSNASGSGDQAS